MPSPLQPHVAYQAPLPMGFSRQEYWNRLPFPPTGDLLDPGIEPASPALAGGLFTTVPYGSLKEIWANTKWIPLLPLPRLQPQTGLMIYKGSWLRRINMKDEKGFAPWATPRGWNWELGYIVLPFPLLLWYITNIVHSRKARFTFLCDQNYFTSFQKNTLIILSSIIKQVPQNVSQIQQIFVSTLLPLMKIRNNSYFISLIKSVFSVSSCYILSKKYWVKLELFFF